MTTFIRITMVLSLLLVGIAGADEKPSGAYGVAIKGYDSVAYFTMGKAVKGVSAINFTWNEAIWHFSKTEHRELFAADPKKYAPRHSGF